MESTSSSTILFSIHTIYDFSVKRERYLSYLVFSVFGIGIEFSYTFGNLAFIVTMTFHLSAYFPFLNSCLMAFSICFLSSSIEIQR